MEDKKKVLKAKKRFFEEMYALDDSETDDEDLDKIPLTRENLRKKSVSHVPAHRRGQLKSHFAVNWEKLLPSPRVLVDRSFYAEDRVGKEDEDSNATASSSQNSRTKPVRVITSARMPQAESPPTTDSSRVLPSLHPSPRVLVPRSKVAFVGDDSSTASDIEDTIPKKVVPVMKSSKKPASAITPEQNIQLTSRMPTVMGRTLSSPLPITKVSVPRPDVVDIDDASTTEDELPVESKLRFEVTRGDSLSCITPDKKVQGRHGLPTTMERTLSSPLPLSRGSKSKPSSTNIIKETPIVSEANPAQRFAWELLPESKLRSLPRTSLPSQTAAKTMADKAKAAKHAAKRAEAKEERKRKRGQPMEFKAEAQQIFKGKVFFFLPNDLNNPSRCRRIQKAQEWGACWTQEWLEREGYITHVIADMRLTYTDVVNYLKLSAWPAHIVLVNEIYPSDCMSFGFLLDPSQQMYQLAGQREVVVVPQTPISPGLSPASPAIKRAKRRAPTQTPPRSEGSDERAAGQQLELLAEAYENRQKEVAKRGLSRKDALDQAILEAREVEGLPMETSDDDELSKLGTEGESASEEVIERRCSKYSAGLNEHLNEASLVETLNSIQKPWQMNFSCMQKHDGRNQDDNPNAHTIEVLQKMADYYERTKDKWRVIAYRKAIACLKKQKNKITTKVEALALPSIGARLAAKIEEIVLTNRLRRLDNATSDNPEDKVLQLFLGIYGVGLVQAQKWISQGYKTLASLSESASLTPNQLIGVDHYKDFQLRIPRPEVSTHAMFIRAQVEAVSPDIEVTVGGSYRRGAPDCGDIDFLLTSPTLSITALRSLFMNSLLPRLFALRYLRAQLTEIDPVTGTKWHGAACLPRAKVQTWRRVDFLLVPWEEMGAALIYFTGNDLFNRSIRLLALKKGMRLNQHGLFKDVMRAPGRQKITEGKLMEAKSEKLIFQHLGVPWRPPEHRIC